MSQSETSPRSCSVILWRFLGNVSDFSFRLTPREIPAAFDNSHRINCQLGLCFPAAIVLLCQPVRTGRVDFDRNYVSYNSSNFFRECLTKTPVKFQTGVLLQFLYLIVPYWFVSAIYRASLVEPWFLLWRDVLVIEPEYLWRDQTSLICGRSVPN